jgi:hypothetical protein
MTDRAIELALKKQRLQMQSAQLRDEMADYGRGIEPVFSLADLTHDAWIWIKQRPAIPLAVAVALMVARPRFVLRWGRRAWLGWQAVQRWRALAGTTTRQAPR